jgi:hypothetical protein
MMNLKVGGLFLRPPFFTPHPHFSGDQMNNLKNAQWLRIHHHFARHHLHDSERGECIDFDQ